MKLISDGTRVKFLATDSSQLVVSSTNLTPLCSSQYLQPMFQGAPRAAHENEASISQIGGRKAKRKKRQKKKIEIMNPATKPISSFRLSSLLRLQKDPRLALHLFQNPNPNPNPDDADSPKPFRYSLLSYDLIITKLGRAKMFDEMQKVLSQLQNETSFSPKEALFCNIIAFYCRARLAGSALKLFDEMPSFRCTRTIKSVNSLLNALLMCKEFDKFREVYMEMGKYGKPDACTYNILIRWFGSNRRMEDACKVFDEMGKRGVCPNVSTFGALIYGLCLNLRLDEALKLKDDMSRVYRVSPNAHVYASLIKGLCDNGKLDSALQLKEEMVKKRVNLDSAIYSTLISGHFKVGRKEEVLRLLEEMTESGCKPDTVTYNAIINGFCKDRDFEAAYKVLDEMMGKGCKPEVVSYNVILCELCKDGKWSEANDLFEDMPRRGCHPDAVSYRILFDGLSDGMQFKEAAFVLDEMVFKGFVPRPASIAKLVDRLQQEKSVELLWSILNGACKGTAVDADLWRRAVAMVFNDSNIAGICELVDSLVAPCVDSIEINS